MSFFSNAQNIEKSFLTILNEYIKHEPCEKKISKDSIIVTVYLRKVESNFVLNLSMYELKYYPNVDTIRTYNGVRMIVNYPINMEKELSKHFKQINEKRKMYKSEIVTIHESASDFLYQINKDNEIYIISTSDDDYYYKRLKKRNLEPV